MNPVLAKVLKKTFATLFLLLCNKMRADVENFYKKFIVFERSICFYNQYSLIYVRRKTVDRLIGREPTGQSQFIRSENNHG